MANNKSKKIHLKSNIICKHHWLRSGRNMSRSFVSMQTNFLVDLTNHSHFGLKTCWDKYRDIQKLFPFLQLLTTYLETNIQEVFLLQWPTTYVDTNIQELFLLLQWLTTNLETKYIRTVPGVTMTYNIPRHKNRTDPFVIMTYNILRNKTYKDDSCCYSNQ